jgi:hypothetical protein
MLYGNLLQLNNLVIVHYLQQVQSIAEVSCWKRDVRIHVHSSVSVLPPMSYQLGEWNSAWYDIDANL